MSCYLQDGVPVHIPDSRESWANEMRASWLRQEHEASEMASRKYGPPGYKRPFNSLIHQYQNGARNFRDTYGGTLGAYNGVPCVSHDGQRCFVRGR